MYHLLEISTMQIPFSFFFTHKSKVLHCMPMFLFCKHSFEYSVLIIKSANEYKKKGQ